MLNVMRFVFLGLALWGGGVGAAPLLLGTTPVVADVVAQVAGPAFLVESLIPAGVDPHAFEPTPRDLQKLLQAALIFQNGAGLEAGLAPFLGLPEVRAKVVDLSAGLPFLEGAEGEPDPHVWWDPTLVARWVERIRDVLSARFPQEAQGFAERASRYLQELAALDAWIREAVEGIPPERRLLVTDHLVLGYFARRYGFRVVGALIPSVETLAEPSPQEIAALEETLRAWSIPAIFVSTPVPSALALRVARDTGARLVALPMEGPPEGGGYLAMMREAVRRLVEALSP